MRFLKYAFSSFWIGSLEGVTEFSCPKYFTTLAVMKCLLSASGNFCFENLCLMSTWLNLYLACIAEKLNSSRGNFFFLRYVYALSMLASMYRSIKLCMWVKLAAFDSYAFLPWIISSSSGSSCLMLSSVFLGSNALFLHGEMWHLSQASILICITGSCRLVKCISKSIYWM